MPASTAPRLLDGQARGALQRARSLAIEELIEIIERSGLRGRGGAGYPFAEKLRAVRRNAQGGDVYLVANGYDADPGSPLARTLLTRNGANVVHGISIAAHAIGATQVYLYLHPEAIEARAAAERAIGEMAAELGVPIEIALGPGGFMGGEESALLAVLESRRAMARQRPPYPAAQGLRLRPTLVSSVETLGILGTSRLDTRLDFDDLRVAGTHMGSAQVRAIAAGTCIVNEAATLFAYLAKENCAICVPCRVGTKRVTAILESTYSGLGRDSDIAWLDELGTHMERFSLCGFGITAPSILRTTMREFPDDYRIHIQEKRCPEGACKPIRSRRYETMVQP